MAEGDEREPLLTDDIRELLRLVNQGDFAEVLIRRGDAKVHIKRSVAQPAAPTFAPLFTTPSVPATSVVAHAPAAAPAAPTEAAEPVVAGVSITAPMVGTYYGAPSPKDAPYVQVGDEVRPGDVVGIIEAMKIMNEIECETQGRVKAILVESGQAVEYGQPLMVIEPM
jgi:acetyl-CoA carboxylase biotin carboxyl carrier protein